MIKDYAMKSFKGKNYPNDNLIGGVFAVILSAFEEWKIQALGISAILASTVWIVGLSGGIILII